MLSVFDSGSVFIFNLNVLQSRLQHEMKKVPKLQKFWNLIKKNLDKMDPKAAEQYEVSLYLIFKLSFINNQI